MGQPQVSEAEEAALRDAVSEGFRTYAEDAVQRGVKYKLGVKDGVTQIDCAGFIDKAVREVFKDYLTEGDKLVLKRPGQNHVFDCGADDQISEVSRKTKTLLSGDQVTPKTLKAGMIVGLDDGPTDSWLPGRSLWNNVSHIVLIYKDPKTDKLMVAQSSASGGGANIQPLDDWYKKVHGAGIKLYATDVVKLAEQIGAKPVNSSQMAANDAQPAAGFGGQFPDVSGDFGAVAPRQQTVQPAPKPAAANTNTAPKPAQ